MSILHFFPSTRYGDDGVNDRENAEKEDKSMDH